MSALGQKRTFCDAGAMSALPLQADIAAYDWNVRLNANTGHQPHISSDEKQKDRLAAVSPKNSIALTSLSPTPLLMLH
jgi:hypothetical protein